jgi:diguanylate cyclase (GGDEF)-like protein
VLRRVAAILAGCFRGEDIVARWGGEEFVIGMYSMPCDAAVQRLELALDKLRSERFETSDATFTITFSAGVAEFPTDGTDWTTLYRLADDSLTQAKMSGRNKVIGGRGMGDGGRGMGNAGQGTGDMGGGIPDDGATGSEESGMREVGTAHR